MARLLKTRPYGFQRRIARDALKLDACGLWMEPGTGKTLVSLKIVGVRWRRNSVRRVLIVGPLNVIGNWFRQLRQHANFRYVAIGPENAKDPVPENFRVSDDRIVFLIVNYDVFRRHWKSLRKIGWDMMIVDEGHRIMHRNSKQSKAVWRVGREVKYRLELTGTPIGKDEIDLWAQARFIDENIFGPNWTPFKKRHLRKTGYMGHKLKIKRGHERIITNKVASHVFRMKARDWLDLPPVVDKAITFSLTGEARKAYDKIETQFMYEFGKLKSTTPLAITRMIRLRQVTGGFLGLDDKSTLKLNQDKLEMFADWMIDFPKYEKLVVFAYFTHEIDMIAALMEKMGRSYFVRDGRTPKRRLNDWMKFQDKREPTTGILQIGAGGEGTDLFASRVGVFYSNTLRYIDYDQARRRLDRHGQTRNVLFVHFVAENTIDEDGYLNLDGKANVANRVLAAIQKRRQRDG